MINRCLLFCISAFIFLGSCAIEVVPTGGQKDVLPPKVLSAKPENNALNFVEKSIKITFDEYITLQNVEEQLIITPSLAKKPDIKLRNKSIMISIEDSLQANTTYTFNFGDAIQDITENNPISGYRYVFSTGNFLDSAIFEGKVVDVKTQKGKEKVLVMLFQKDVDSLPRTTIPYYVTRTNSLGNFQFFNLKAGRYKVFALDDKDGDFKYNLPNEAIAFMENMVNIGDTLQKQIELKMFETEAPALKIMDKMAVRYGLLRFVFNKPFEKIELQNMTDGYAPDWSILEMGVNKDTLFCWMPQQKSDSIRLLIKHNNQIIDTISMALKQKEDNSSNRRTKTANHKLMVSADKKADLDKPFVINLSNPLIAFDTALLRLTLVSDTISNAKISYTLDSLHKRLFVAYPFNEAVSYMLHIQPLAFKDIFGNSNDSLSFKFSTYSKDYYGTCKMQFKYPEKGVVPYYVYLKDDKDRTVWEGSIDKSQIINLSGLYPGKYRLYAYYDVNKNNKWDTGDYDKKRQAEQIIFYKEELLFRSNWEVEVDWDLPLNP